MTDDLSAWIGRSVDAVDLTTAAPVARLAATLDHDGAHWPTNVVPPLGHWLFHLPNAERSALGPDGHPARGKFLPPIPQPRRMWAGGRLDFVAPIPFGATITKRSTVQSIEPKGTMTFVTVRHEVSVDGGVAVIEEQDLVYLPITPPGAPKPFDRPAPEHQREMIADEALLFRYSALTFNGHRIHYDLPYAREIELYPALVVHGPLQATLLIDEAQQVGEKPVHFAFRGRAPLYAGKRFTIARAGEEWWIRDEDGTVTMTATIKTT
jgi:3-methylfumaryl-CoA hydratase